MTVLGFVLVAIGALIICLGPTEHDASRLHRRAGGVLMLVGLAVEFAGAAIGF